MLLSKYVGCDEECEAWGGCKSGIAVRGRTTGKVEVRSANGGDSQVHISLNCGSIDGTTHAMQRKRKGTERKTRNGIIWSTGIVEVVIKEEEATSAATHVSNSH